MPNHILVTGPSRSGKSEWAESLAAQSQQAVIYIATAIAPPDDPEWLQRIEQHRVRRPTEWELRECPLELAALLRNLPPHHCALVDSLGTWVANCLDQSPDQWQATVAEFLASVQACAAQLIVVAEEVGWGVVPAYASGRCFRDRLGELCQHLSPLMAQVYLVAAGFALPLHQWGICLKRLRVAN
ncbi:MAG: bifunctional adenosylcobinamide kinase/adenosylcobinamide-phosphate guanylyltransferase [Thermosynechococcus sp. Uc]|uniref:bifunctional adenosylcobinamide kinase/adenosylcobinamide-phosphate guanylyltransferase n=1 Tax=Thermosynechococcus sp. Uc TaxID=3034853 RepID=UPI0019DB8CE9|nr:bifunctional adenosylcobinamide kinase/adenosylcobinamide-phosphate guanylyltransferase [Thermosynechococcus sp. Uc]MDM7327646.1 bifunctional adenosylcobinamide kinase/adenosylcobinamide-phosphate guanylyltransferase [Thermosynechococcus sp. Uc]HIK25198.1 bifunctional adenosylcobinamide kinase/adenosylcobinamide-phosphate guanylyltransferase [Thermosynechococcus sp. M46_R2017_013]